MRRFIFIIMIGCLGIAAQAQPQARRQQQAAATQKSNANNMTTRAQISFPTEAKMGRMWYGGETSIVSWISMMTPTPVFITRPSL